MHRLRRDRGDVQVLLERVDLRAEGVAPHGHVQHAEPALIRRRVADLPGQHDQPRARAVGGQAVAEGGDERVLQPHDPGEAVHHGGLAAGQHDAVQTLEVRGAAHGARARAEGLEHVHVLPHVALEGEHADGLLWTHQPRSARRCGAPWPRPGRGRPRRPPSGRRTGRWP
ncbi:Uncharacterised protein [Streptococcus pneumoniae]|nr:Uncharacterised protein [Streptococcus pneumoniae]